MGRTFAVMALVVIATAISVDRLRLFTPTNGDEGKKLSAQLIPLDGVTGPESLAFDERERGPYTGVSDGRILQWLGPDSGWRQFAVSAPYLCVLSLFLPFFFCTFFSVTLSV